MTADPATGATLHRDAMDEQLVHEISGTILGEGHAALLLMDRAETGCDYLVVTGAGVRFFCTGGDLKAYRAISTPTELAETFAVVRGLLDALEAHPLPVIAAINGYALGGGAELALACDLRFATAAAKIGLPQAKLGIIPGWNGSARLMRAVGYAKAMRMLLTCEQLSAAEALADGLLDGVTDGDVVDHAVGFLAGLPAAPLAVSAT